MNLLTFHFCLYLILTSLHHFAHCLENFCHFYQWTCLFTFSFEYVFIFIRALRYCEDMIQRYSRAINNSSLSASNAMLPHCSFSNVGKAVEDCMRAVIGVLLNLTHDNGILNYKFLCFAFELESLIPCWYAYRSRHEMWNNIQFCSTGSYDGYYEERFLIMLFSSAEWGSTKTGEQEQLIETALNCVLRVPRYILQEQRFDVRVLVRYSWRQAITT